MGPGSQSAQLMPSLVPAVRSANENKRNSAPTPPLQNLTQRMSPLPGARWHLLCPQQESRYPVPQESWDPAGMGEQQELALCPGARLHLVSTSSTQVTLKGTGSQKKTSSATEVAVSVSLCLSLSVSVHLALCLCLPLSVLNSTSSWIESWSLTLAINAASPSPVMPHPVSPSVPICGTSRTIITAGKDQPPCCKPLMPHLRSLWTACAAGPSPAPGLSLGWEWRRESALSASCREALWVQLIPKARKSRRTGREEVSLFAGDMAD